MPAPCIILCYREPSLSDMRLARLADFLGVACEFHAYSSIDSATDRMPRHSARRSHCVMTSALSLGKLMENSRSPHYSMGRLFEQTGALFVHGFHPSESAIDLVKYLTRGAISSVRSFVSSNLSYQIASSYKAITGELSGLSAAPIRQDIDFGFMLPSNWSEFATLISIGGHPFWGRFDKGQCAIFLLACDDVVDVDERIDGRFRISDYFSRLVPYTMFLKYVFQSGCWHNPCQLANFLIDDPLLRESYGFLAYRELLRRTQHTAFSATIGFIPWNYKRTNPATAKLFQTHSDKLSICVHGCDHTGGEFGTSNLRVLYAKSRLASERMRTHQTLTGVPCANVMVFPQGRFSSQALKALKLHNYLAAVNSDPLPQDREKSFDLRLSDMLSPAITKWEGFPLFLRRYPSDFVDLALDLFLGKPLLAVEHHKYFQNGYQKLIDFIEKVNSVAPKVEWKGISEVLARTCLMKDVSDNVTYCRIFSNYQIIQNFCDAPRKYIVMKDEAGDVPIKRVSVNGETAEFCIHNDILQLELNVDAKSSATVQVIYRDETQYTENRQPLVERSRVYVRRALSEFRDNFLSRNDLLLSLAHGVARRLF